MPRPLHPDVNRFGNHLPDTPLVDDRHISDCRWDDCREAQMSDEIQLCEQHAWVTHMRLLDIIEGPRAGGIALPGATPVVYYLMLSATTLKIGTTGDLVRRVRSLRTDMQYVVAVEPGSYEVERQRHKTFAAERLGRREDFHLSDLLSDHIKNLRSTTYSDELLEMYVSLAHRPARPR